MPLPGVDIREIAPQGAGLSSRADVAVFVGLVPRTAAPLPQAVRDSLGALGWAGDGPFARAPDAVEALLDVPVPVESWSLFETLFDWRARAIEPGDPRRIPCPLGLAVRSFFAAGGVKAWVVRTGDPIALTDRALSDAEELARRAAVISWPAAAPPADADRRAPLIPGFDGRGTPPDPFDPCTWTGAAHAWGVEGAAMLLLPDLPDLMAGRPRPAPEIAPPPPPPETFKPCAPAAPGAEAPARAPRLALQAPRLDQTRATRWAAALKTLLDMLGRPRGPAHRRDVMLIASLPIPEAGDDPLAVVDPADPMRFLDAARLPDGAALLDAAGLGSGRLMLAYPWLATAAARPAPEGVEGAEGALAGALAAAALAKGAYRSAAGARLDGVRDTLPRLGSGDLARALPGGRADWAGERLCLVGRRLDDHALLSDATLAEARAWRAGGASRLAGILQRAARGLGQDLVFDASGEELWARIRGALEGLMERLAARGAFAGTGPGDSYAVRCDRSTMTQADIDNGRVVAEVDFRAAQPIDRITVSLALTAARPGALREVA